MAEPPSTAQSVGTFVAAYAAATTVTVIPVLIVNPKRYDKPKWELILKKAWAHSRRNFRLALLPVVLPIVYRTAHRFLTRRKEELEGSDASLPGNQHLRIVKKLYNVLPALLSSPLFILLPEGIRVQVALYFLSSFLYTFTRLKAKPQVKFEDDCNRETKDVKERRMIWQRSGKEILENWRDYLPPVWTVSMLANTCLLWTFIFEPHAFPDNYHDGFIEHCRRYLPISRTLEDVRRILNNTDHARSIWSSPHEYIVCEVLHPTQVSCRKNFTSAFREEANRFAPWVAGATAVNMLFSGRFQFGKRGFTTVVFDFINSTFRGTTYLTGSITTVWAISCVLQRILPIGKFAKSRWIINSSLSSMWILLLSRSRQVAISLFQFRLAAYSMWKVWKSRGGRSIKHGDLWLIAACWVGLIHYKDRTVGKRITGMIGQFMRMVDGSEFEEWVTERKRNEKGKGREDGQGNGGSSSVVRPPRPQSPKPYFPPKPTPGVYGPDSPGRGFSTPRYGPSTPSYSTPGPSGSARGLYGTPAPAPPPPPPPPSQPYPPPPSQSYQQPPSQSYQQPPSQSYQQPPPQPFHPPTPNAVPAPGQPSNYELYSKPFGGAGTPASHQEPDKIEPISKLGVSAMTSRFENTSTPPPRDMQEPIQVSRGGSAGSFSPVEAPQQPMFPMRVDPPSRATTAGDPFSDAKRVVDDPHELSEVGSGSAADISASTASGDGGNVLVHVDAPHGLGEEQHRDDDRDSIDSDDRMLMIDNSMTLAESPQSGISLLPRVEGEGAGMADSMGSSGLVHVEKP